MGRYFLLKVEAAQAKKKNCILPSLWGRKEAQVCVWGGGMKEREAASVPSVCFSLSAYGPLKHTSTFSSPNHGWGRPPFVYVETEAQQTVTRVSGMVAQQMKELALSLMT